MNASTHLLLHERRSIELASQAALARLAHGAGRRNEARRETKAAR